MHVQVHLQSTLFVPKNKYSTKLFIYTLMHNVSDEECQHLLL